MPLVRYFFYVGGVLLALLFVLDAYLPNVPVAQRADANSPVIRIHSDQKWPERIVFDTSLPTIIPPQIASDAADVPSLATAADVSAKARERETFAQMQASDARQLQPSDPKRREAKLQHQHKIAKRRPAPPARLVWRQPQFGWFANHIW